MKFSEKIKKNVGTIPLFFKALRSKETPLTAKALVLASIAYVVVPTDIIADVIPVVGLLDDAVVLQFLIYLSTKLIPDSLLENKVEAKEEF